MRMKLYDLRSGSTVEKTMRPEEKVEQAIVDTKDAQYLILKAMIAVFMDMETYEQYEIPTATIQNEMKFMLENMNVKIDYFNSEVIGITLPNTVQLKVAETEPSIKGATVAGSGKSATMETGLVVTVPDFIKEGKFLISTHKRELTKVVLQSITMKTKKC